MGRPRPPIICASCARLDREAYARWADGLGEEEDRGSPDGPRGRCSAFPAGIPDEIWRRRFDHRQPFSGDGGVRFLLDSGREDILSAYERNEPLD